MLRRMAKVCLSAELNTLVVLGSSHEAHYKEIEDLNVSIVVNHEWQMGMGSSIKAGLREAIKNPSSAVIVLVCDQPYVTSNYLISLISKHQTTSKPIITSSYQDIQGVPVLFHQSKYNDLLRLTDGEGARQMIHRHQSEVATVDFPNGAIDLDTDSDYQAFIKTNPLE